jgi:hypothetical protein
MHVYKYIEVDFIIVQLCIKLQSSSYHAIQLNNNGKLRKVQALEELKIKQLYHALRNISVLTDFRQYYKVDKVVGKGATAKVSYFTDVQ